MNYSYQIAKVILRYNRILVLTILVAGFGLVSGISQLNFVTNERAFFSDSNQEMVDIRHNDDIYAGSDGILLMIVPPIGEAFSTNTLEFLRTITADMWQTPYVLRVESPVNYTHTYAVDEEIIVEPLLEEGVEITQHLAARFKQIATSSKELKNRLVGENQKAFGISIQVVLPANKENSRQEVIHFLNDKKKHWASLKPGFDLRFTGGVFGGETLAMAARHDALTLVPISLAAVIILQLIFLRSVAAVAAGASIVFMTTLVTFGFAGWLGVELTAGTAISPLATMTLTATSCVHITLSWLRRLQPDQYQEAAQASLTENLGPIFIATLTTAIGFLGMNFADSPPLQQMGNIVAFGLIFGMFASLVILPVWLMRSSKKSSNDMYFSESRMIMFCDWILVKRKMWLIVFPLVLVGAIGGIQRIGFDDSLIRYFDNRFVFRQNAEAIANQLTGLDSIHYSFKSPGDAGVFSPQFLQDIERFQSWLGDQENVASVSSITDIIKRMNKSMSGDDPAQARIADTREANAQLMMFYELSLPVGLDLNSSIDVDRTETRLIAIVRAGHSEDIRNLAERSEAWLQENAPTIATRASGSSVAFARVSERNNALMLQGLIVVLVLVSAILMFTVKSVKFGLISLIPNLFPAILAFGFWGILVGDVNLGSTVVTTMTFGIVVDDTVHFLMHFLRGRKSGLSPKESMRQTFSVVGAAIIITSLSLVTGFVIMATSGFAINLHIGALSAVIVAFALIADLLLLPSVLMLSERTRR